MSLTLTVQPTLIEYTVEQREAWRCGKRDDCSDRYCARMPGTGGFGEYLVSKYWEQRGYRWIHHDYDLFGFNRPGKYPEAEAILRSALGADRLSSFRALSMALRPLGEGRRAPVEQPDLLIYTLDRKAVRFAECKRSDTRDNLRPRQVLSLYLIGTLLRSPVDLFLIAENGAHAQPESITLSF